jgi:tRNA(Ile)-lysidine synthetase-like protein
MLNYKSVQLCDIPSNAIVSVSGGIDSIVIAHYVKRFYNVNSLYHFNHKIQMINDEMERKVRQFAIDFKFNSWIKRASCELKSEAECREARLSAIFDDYKDITLITAHHLNDCQESLLMNVFRGHFDYMPIPITSEFKNNNRIIHPFLNITKKELYEYACKNDLLKYVVNDPTNEQIKGSRRNMIRNCIIPILEREKIGLDTVIKRKFYNTENTQQPQNKKQTKHMNTNTNNTETNPSDTKKYKTVIYKRVRNKQGVPIGVFLAKKTPTGEVLVGYSFVHKNDKFNIEEGKRIASKSAKWINSPWADKIIIPSKVKYQEELLRYIERSRRYFRV